ncbi:hypothetical protein HPB48_010711 [Haemaphysalis longicornis]|uniref:Uncharacterized protein n=1 Tax=Haemaphysalis longicornis TaxID=44386 RepID=A0A9J6G545_HAELO|nr:hypothetical protein HPB48_010711 [Haemaphysalis longicornis]
MAAPDPYAFWIRMSVLVMGVMLLCVIVCLLFRKYVLGPHFFSAPTYEEHVVLAGFLSQKTSSLQSPPAIPASSDVAASWEPSSQRVLSPGHKVVNAAGRTLDLSKSLSTVTLEAKSYHADILKKPEKGAPRIPRIHVIVGNEGEWPLTPTFTDSSSNTTSGVTCTDAPSPKRRDRSKQKPTSLLRWDVDFDNTKEESHGGSYVKSIVVKSQATQTSGNVDSKPPPVATTDDGRGSKEVSQDEVLGLSDMSRATSSSRQHEVVSQDEGLGLSDMSRATSSSRQREVETVTASQEPMTDTRQHFRKKRKHKSVISGASSPHLNKSGFTPSSGAVYCKNSSQVTPPRNPLTPGAQPNPVSRIRRRAIRGSPTLVQGQVPAAVASSNEDVSEQRSPDRQSTLQAPPTTLDGLPSGRDERCPQTTAHCLMTISEKNPPLQMDAPRVDKPASSADP